MAQQISQLSTKEKEYNVRLFFSTVQMLAINEYDISPYEELLREFEVEEEFQKRGKETQFIRFEDLSQYIDDVNVYNYGCSVNFPKGRFMSFFATNNKTKKIKYICYYDNEGKDISADDVQAITDNCMSVSKSNNENDQGVEFFGTGSNYESLIITSSKIGSYSKERMRGIKNIKLIQEEVVFIRPFNHIFQSTIEKMPIAKYEKDYGKIPRANMPSISSSDSYMTYREISKVPTEIHRERINEIELITNTIHVKIVN